MSQGQDKKKATPDYFHVLRPPFKDNVYEPEADTFLFLDALDAVAGELRDLPRCRCLEIGCGSGTVITHLASLLLHHRPEGAVSGNQDKGEGCGMFREFHAVDVNPLAIEATKMTWKKTVGDWDLHIHTGDLFSPFPLDGSASMDCKFDVILFNPPYVPTTQDELSDAIAGDQIKRAWCGGPKGRAVIDRFLVDLPRWLRAGGRALVVAIKQNNVDDLIAFTRDVFVRNGSSEPSIRVVVSRFTGEELCVLEILAPS